MHHACAQGSVAVCVKLAPSSAMFQDNYGITPAEYALLQGHEALFDEIVAIAAKDLVQSTIEDKKDVQRHRAYLESKVIYKGDVLYDRVGRGVMMGWERVLMRAHVETLLAGREGPIRILNVGFGMGIFDALVQEVGAQKNCTIHHTICEPHPDVLAKMDEHGWASKATIVRSTWQQMVFTTAKYDAIFFDTYEEGLVDLFAFFAKASSGLAVGGCLSYYNGAAPYNLFFHMVQNEACREHLRSLGCSTSFELIDVGDIDWSESKQRYWQFDHYLVPRAVKCDGIPERSNTRLPKPMPTASYNMVTGVLVERSKDVQRTSY
eukprot:GEMP01022653.1.p1 GENE.GEMP01022653.1~~GEMP01022653.1.p1  ORF type:complete len:321 (+),score=68.88 GEMP01022653.1:729-1691(+)